MVSARARHGSYLFRRSGSVHWWIRLRSGGKRVEKSLGTSDRLQAELAAAEVIGEHKARLLAARPHLVTVWQHKLEPGRKHVDADGSEIIATDRELLYVGDDGAITWSEANGGWSQRAVALFQTHAEAIKAVRRPNWGAKAYADAERPVVVTKNRDDVVLETYLKHRKITGYIEREARTTWALFKSLCDKPLEECNRDDGRKLVAHFEAQGLKSKTIEKKIAWLNAALNLAIDEGRHKTINPFAAIVPDLKDSQRRLPLKDADIKAVKQNLLRLDKSDQLLVRLLASTGMRLSEAYEIDGEEKERGVRFVIVGKKNEQSLRRVPLPAAVVPYLPKSIKGPLFDQLKNTDPSDAASKRLNKFLRRIGIVDKAKVVHSLRHRAQDRLRAAGCPQDVRWALLGHEETTVAAGYGEGFPVPLLRKWIDKIGF
jgi:integrase